MTYKYTKKDGWLGFCDICNQPYAPLFVRMRDDSYDRFVIDMKTFRKVSRSLFIGKCASCKVTGHGYESDEYSEKDEVTLLFHRFGHSKKLKFDEETYRHSFGGFRCGNVNGVAVFGNIINRDNEDVCIGCSKNVKFKCPECGW